MVIYVDIEAGSDYVYYASVDVFASRQVVTMTRAC